MQDVRLLVVDDHAELRRVMVEFLQRQEGIASVREAENGVEALNILASWTFPGGPAKHLIIGLFKGFLPSVFPYQQQGAAVSNVAVNPIRTDVNLLAEIHRHRLPRSGALPMGLWKGRGAKVGQGKDAVNQHQRPKIDPIPLCIAKFSVHGQRG